MSLLGAAHGGVGHHTASTSALIPGGFPEPEMKDVQCEGMLLVLGLWDK